MQKKCVPNWWTSFQPPTPSPLLTPMHFQHRLAHVFSKSLPIHPYYKIKGTSMKMLKRSLTIQNFQLRFTVVMQALSLCKCKAVFGSMSSYNFHGYFRAKEAVDSMKLLTFYLRTGHRITWQGVVSQLASQPTYLGYTSGTMLGRHMSCQCPVNQNSCLCVYKLSVGISSHPQWHPAETDMKSFSWRTSFHEDCPS